MEFKSTPHAIMAGKDVDLLTDTKLTPIQPYDMREKGGNSRPFSSVFALC